MDYGDFLSSQLFQDKDRSVSTATDFMQSVSDLTEIPLVFVLNYTNMNSWKSGPQHVIGVWRRHICDLERKVCLDLTPENLYIACGENVCFKGVQEGLAITCASAEWSTLIKDFNNEFLFDTWSSFNIQFESEAVMNSLKNILSNQSEMKKSRRKGERKRKRRKHSL